MRINILGFSYSEFLPVFQSATSSGGEYYAKSLYRQVFKNGLFKPEDISEFRKSPRILAKTQEAFEVSCLTVKSSVKSGNAEKLVFQTKDGLHIESVIIPMKGRKTLCISSQAGCRMGCVFCETGRMKFARNLDAAEIVSQLYHVFFRMEEKIRNVVFMGMGEPLDNMDEVFKAVDVFTDIRGFGFKRTHITVSTCGLADKIALMGEWAPGKCLLAVSVNSADEKTRSMLMPVNRKHSLRELKEVLLKYPLAGSDAIFIEYVLISGVNDSEKDALLLADYLAGLKARVNLIPYNSTSDCRFFPSGTADRDNFYKIIRNSGIRVIRRNEKGASIRAACGQLAGSTLSGKKK